MNWNSHRVCRSEREARVEFIVRRMTFGRRIELMRLVRDLALKLEFFEAGRDARNHMEASLLAAEIDRLYLLWGLDEVRGLSIDGLAPSVEQFIESGPEPLVLEALHLVRSECELDQHERKNS